jgi:hypothetical protein
MVANISGCNSVLSVNFDGDILCFMKVFRFCITIICQLKGGRLSSTHATTNFARTGVIFFGVE